MIFASFALQTAPLQTVPAWVLYAPEKSIRQSSNVGKGKHIVFLAGDEEYRSEEALPQMAKILAARHGFKCTVVFSINPSAEIDPNFQKNQPGIEALKTADLCVMMLRFRNWPAEQMRHFHDYVQSGKPIFGIRTSTHAFDYSAEPDHPFSAYGWRNAKKDGGFGKRVLGENWISHWGNHGSEATLGVFADTRHPILKGVTRIFSTTDVYEAAPPADAKIVAIGQVLAAMTPDSGPAKRSKSTSGGKFQDVNSPMMPILWTRENLAESGKSNRVVTWTFGTSTDFLQKEMRLLFFNSVLYALKMETRIDAKNNLELVGEYSPLPFGFNQFRKSVKPFDLRWPQ